MSLIRRLMRLLGGNSDTNSQGVAMSVPGWSVTKHEQDATHWENSSGDVMSLTRVVGAFPPLSDIKGVWRRFQDPAQRQGAGIVQIDVVTGVDGPAVIAITKKLFEPAFVFTGRLVAGPELESPFLWTVVCVEQGTTGGREAFVAAKLMNDGTLTPEDYATSWVQDPYDLEAAGVDRRTLRYLSDDEIYDTQFPMHPLSKVRQELKKLRKISLISTGSGMAGTGPTGSPA